MASGKRDSNPRPLAWEIYYCCVRVYLSVVCERGCFYGKQFTNTFIAIYRHLMLFLFVEHVDRGVVRHEWIVIIGLDVAVLTFEMIDQHLQVSNDFPLVFNRIV